MANGARFFCPTSLFFSAPSTVNKHLKRLDDHKKVWRQHRTLFRTFHLFLVENRKWVQCPPIYLGMFTSDGGRVESKRQISRVTGPSLFQTSPVVTMFGSWPNVRDPGYKWPTWASFIGDPSAGVEALSRDAAPLYQKESVEVEQIFYRSPWPIFKKMGKARYECHLSNWRRGMPISAFLWRITFDTAPFGLTTQAKHLGFLFSMWKDSWSPTRTWTLQRTSTFVAWAVGNGGGLGRRANVGVWLS